jgi:hypothetical protein
MAGPVESLADHRDWRNKTRDVGMAAKGVLICAERTSGPPPAIISSSSVCPRARAIPLAVPNIYKWMPVEVLPLIDHLGLH